MPRSAASPMISSIPPVCLVEEAAGVVVEGRCRPTVVKNSSSRPLPPGVVVDGRGLVWRGVEVVVDSDGVIWEDKLLLVLGAVAKDVFFFCRTLAMVKGEW